jgi:hypothetical protein
MRQWLIAVMLPQAPCIREAVKDRERLGLLRRLQVHWLDWRTPKLTVRPGLGRPASSSKTHRIRSAADRARR